MNNIQPLKPSKQFEEAIIAEKKRLDEYIKQFGNSQVASDYLKGYYDREIVNWEPMKAEFHINGLFKDMVNYERLALEIEIAKSREQDHQRSN
ncbi:MAG: hypothetical protein SPJ50_09145 [Ligilactobacillus salivarius]|nr:hypothetical protein [Ligilactobacillus salivarius]MDY5247740.1 hypothetical protein [Ligilactobacillus salivarius]